jgi:hypothetical protein
MDRILSVVKEVFDRAGQGCVIFPGIPIDSTYTVKVRDPIRLIRPDKSIIETCISGIEIFTGAVAGPFPIRMPPEIQKSDIPIGTKIVLA